MIAIRSCLLFTLVINFGSIITVKGQLSEIQAKALLFNRITELSEYEGIFDIKSVFINSAVCHSEREVMITDRIAIIKMNDQLRVISLTDKQEIGQIVLRYQNGYYGNLITTGFSKYPNLKIRGDWWETEIGYNEDYHYYAQKQLLNEINRLKYQCNWPEWCQTYGQVGACNTSIKYRLDKVFPNKNEPPPATTSTGTGIIITKQGHVITNKHVVEKTTYVWNDGWPIKTWISNKTEFANSPFSNVSTNIKGFINGKEYELVPVAMVDKIRSNLFTIDKELMMLDPEDKTLIEVFEDLIVLKIVNPPLNLKYSILDLKTPELGEEVYALGYPLSSTLDGSLIYSNGYFSTQTAGADIYNMSVNPGNSGCGIFSKTNGNLIGVVTARINDDIIGVKTEAICFGTRLDNLTKIITSESTGFCELNRSYSASNGIYWDINQAYLLYNKTQFSLFFRDNNFKTRLTVEDNKQATIQIIAH